MVVAMRRDQWEHPCHDLSCPRKGVWPITDGSEVRYYCSAHVIDLQEAEPGRWDDVPQ